MGPSSESLWCEAPRDGGKRGRAVSCSHWFESSVSSHGLQIMKPNLHAHPLIAHAWHSGFPRSPAHLAHVELLRLPPLTLLLKTTEPI